MSLRSLSRYLHQTFQALKTLPTPHSLGTPNISYMLPRFSHFLLRHPPFEHAMARAITCSSQHHFYHTPNNNNNNNNNSTRIPSSLHSRLVLLSNPRHCASLSSKCSSLFGRGFHALCQRNEGRKRLGALVGGVRAGQREYRKVRRRALKAKEKELELCVDICIEEDLPDDPEILVLHTPILCFSFPFFFPKKIILFYL